MWNFPNENLEWPYSNGKGNYASCQLSAAKKARTKFVPVVIVQKFTWHNLHIRGWLQTQASVMSSCHTFDLHSVHKELGWAVRQWPLLYWSVLFSLLFITIIFFKSIFSSQGLLLDLESIASLNLLRAIWHTRVRHDFWRWLVAWRTRVHHEKCISVA